MSRAAVVALAVKFLGVGGLIGFLVAAHHWPAWATPLRTGAVVWFLALGVVYAWSLRRRPGGCR
jgi:hypothetical protein